MATQFLVHDNQLIDEQLLIEMNPDVCQKEIRVTLATIAQSFIQCLLTS